LMPNGEYLEGDCGSPAKNDASASVRSLRVYWDIWVAALFRTTFLHTECGLSTVRAF
jgi:hypothetical protein